MRGERRSRRSYFGRGSGVALAALAVGGAFASCGGEAGRVVQPADLVTGAGAPSASAPPVAFVEPNASSEPPNPASSTAPPDALTPALPERPPRTGAPGSTRGTISCGARRCDASREKCVESKVGLDWECVPRSAAAGAAAACDDGTDCPAGETCCEAWSSAATEYVCVSRADVDAHVGCRTEVCQPGGAACPAGQVCREDACGPRFLPRATCGGKRCPEVKPVCIVQPGRAPRCATSDEAGAASTALISGEGQGIGVHGCTVPSDCGPGFSCCTGGALGDSVTGCAAACDFSNTGVVCATRADCAHWGRVVCGGAADPKACERGVSCNRGDTVRVCAVP